MHGTLFIALPKILAKTSLAARRLTCDYLEEEGFAPLSRFAGCADHFSVGGRSSGLLRLIRLRQEQPGPFKRYWKALTDDSPHESSMASFKKLFPTYSGRVPLLRANVPYLGHPDDAMIFDEPLFESLKDGFDDVFTYSWGLDEKPCVLYNGGDEGEDWPEKKEDIVGKIWVVVVDYGY